MKKLILISLCAISLCKAADNSWDQAVQRNYPNGIQQLQELYLDNNQITEIPANLNNLPQLQGLFLQYNLITEIPNLNLPQLGALILGHNLITEIPNLNLPQLLQLYLDGNQITEIPNLNLPQLRQLSLSNNRITNVNPQILQQFPHLVFLNLNQNPITQENVTALRDAAAEIFDATGRNIQIIADDIGDQYLPEGYNIKGAD